MLGIYTHVRFKSDYMQCIEVYLNVPIKKNVLFKVWAKDQQRYICPTCFSRNHLRNPI